ncbi:hypothetical protein [Ornithinimicrobium kibberense]|uniref:hypothetical protein n=1 Tax=Ornithinimicrobium kibberense TaxID=282060 RepID=UPI003606D368
MAVQLALVDPAGVVLRLAVPPDHHPTGRPPAHASSAGAGGSTTVGQSFHNRSRS